MHERLIPEAGQVRQKYDEFRPFEGGVFDSLPQRKQRSGGVLRFIQKVADALSHRDPDPYNSKKPSQIRPGQRGYEEFPLGGIQGVFDDEPDHR